MFGMLQANFAFQRHFTHDRDLIGFFSSWSSELSCNRQAFLLTFCCGRVIHRSLEDRKEPSLPRTTCEKLYAESVSFLNDLLKQQKNPLLNLNVSFVMNFWQCSSKLFISVFNMFTLWISNYMYSLVLDWVLVLDYYYYYYYYYYHYRYYYCKQTRKLKLKIKSTPSPALSTVRSSDRVIPCFFVPFIYLKMV